MTPLPPEHSRNPKIATIEFNDESVERIASILGVGIDLAPFRMPGSNVWQMTIFGSNGRPAVLLTLWSGLKRVDAISGLTTVVLNDVVSVDLVPEVEVQFRTRNRGMLIIARKGNVIVRA
jgi:hypothetical protein